MLAYIEITKNHEEELRERIQQKYGEIHFDGNVEVPWIRVGRGESYISTGTGEAPFLCPEKSGGKGELFKAFIRDKKLIFSTIIYSETGKAIAAVIENEWQIDNADYDYNNDPQAFEVVTTVDNRVLFQVDFKDGVVQVIGAFRNADGNGIYVHDTLDENGQIVALIGLLSENVPFKLPSDPKPLFRYPRAKHFGVRATLNR